eukprot:707708-Rhodomonas_salina.3
MSALHLAATACTRTRNHVGGTRKRLFLSKQRRSSGTKCREKEGSCARFGGAPDSESDGAGAAVEVAREHLDWAKAQVQTPDAAFGVVYQTCVEEAEVLEVAAAPVVKPARVTQRKVQVPAAPHARTALRHRHVCA